MSTREHVTTTWGALRKGDRFADGWRVEQVTVAATAATLILAKPGVTGTLVKPEGESVTVSRAVSTAGRYVRQSRVNRETGTTIEVLDLAATGSEFTPEPEGRYATVCADHSCIVTHPTLALATSHAANPYGWCDACRAIADGCTCTYSGMEITDTDPSCPEHGA